MAVKSADQISIVDLTDGYSVNLTTDSFTFAGDTTKVKSTQTFSTTIYGYCGSSAVTAAVDTTTLTLPTGLTVASDGDTISPTLTFTATTSLTLDILTAFGGAVDIPIVLDGGEITLHKSVSLAIALTGSTPASPYSIIMGNEAQVIACDKDGATLAADTITIPFSIFQGTSRKACTVTYSTLPSGITLGSNNAGTTSADGSLLLNVAANANFGADTTYTGEITLTFSCNSQTFVKKFTWSKALTGATGGKGDKGDPGDDAITIAITSSNGTIFKNSAIATTLTAHVYQGGTELNTTQIAALGTIKWYKDGATTTTATGQTLTISAGDGTNKASYIAQLEG